MKTTTLRLRRVRFKDGRTIEVLRQPQTENIADRLTRTAALSIDSSKSKVVGYALVVWYADGLVFPAYYNGDQSPILAGQVPQYVKDCLLTEVACRWAKDD